MRSGNKYNLHFGINSFWKFTYNFKTIKLSSIFKLRLFFLSKVCLLLYRLKPFSIKFYEYNSFFIFSIWIFFFLKKKIKKIRKKKKLKKKNKKNKKKKKLKKKNVFFFVLNVVCLLKQNLKHFFVESLFILVTSFNQKKNKKV